MAEFGEGRGRTVVLAVGLGVEEEREEGEEGEEGEEEEEEEEKENVLVACEMRRSEDGEMVILALGITIKVVELPGVFSWVVVFDASIELATVTNAMVGVEDSAVKRVVHDSILLELSPTVIDGEEGLCWSLLLELTSVVIGSSALVGRREAVLEIVTEASMELVGSTVADVARVGVAESG